MISLPSDLNHRLKGIGNVSKLISELLYAWLKLQEDKRDELALKRDPESDRKLSDAIKLSLSSLMGREPTQEELDDYIFKYKESQMDMEEWYSARKKQESMQEQLSSV